MQNGTVEAGQTASYYYVGKDPTFAFDCAVPFGLNARQQNAWMYVGGGLELMRDFFKDYNIVQFPAGNTGAQMGGWFRNEIKSVDDLKGLKFRIAGIAGKVLASLGVVPQQIAGGDIYPALEKGTIDAAEWVGPYDDEKLGFYKVAQILLLPRLLGGRAAALDLCQRQAMGSAAQDLPGRVRGRGGAIQYLDAGEIRRRQHAGAAPPRRRRGDPEALPQDVMEAAYKASFALYDQISTENPKFKKVYDAWKQFRADEYLWFRVAENTFDNFVYAQSAKKL